MAITYNKQVDSQENSPHIIKEESYLMLIKF